MPHYFRHYVHCLGSFFVDYSVLKRLDVLYLYMYICKYPVFRGKCMHITDRMIKK